MNYLERNPIRLKYMKESLKQYHLIKKNKYLDRKKRTVIDDDIDICNCISCNSSTMMYKSFLFIKSKISILKKGGSEK